MACEAIRIGCPECGAAAVKNGIRNGGQAWRCNGCGHQFMGDPARRRLSRAMVDVIKILLSEGVEVAKIAKAAKVSKRQVYSYRKMLDG